MRDTECKGDRICVKGLCADPPKSTSVCSTDTECKGDDVCNDGRCVAPSVPPPAPPPQAASPPAPLVAPYGPSLPVSPALPAPQGEHARPGRVILGGWVGGSFVPGVGSAPTSYQGVALGQPSYHIYGGGVEGGGVVRVGVSSFPGADGGNWHGLNAQVLGGFYGSGLVYPNDGDGMLTISGSIVLGYEILHFSPLDPSGEPQQKGIGARAGLRFGFQWDDVIGDQATAGTDPTIGVLVTLVVPTYHTRKGRLSAALLNFGAWALPGTGITLYSIGGGGEF